MWIKRSSLLVLLVACLIWPSTSMAAEKPPSPPMPQATGQAREIKVDLPALLPGSFWLVGGELSPAEDTVITLVHFDQGLTLLRRGSVSFLVYGAIDGSKDTEGYDWNNKVVAQGGFKTAYTFSHGVVQTGVAYAYEERFKSNTSNDAVIGYANYWMGWDSSHPEAERGAFTSFPGTSWGSVGNISPAEKGNILASVSTTQGVTALSMGSWAIVPFGNVLVSADTDGHDWNNKRVLGAGIKMVVPRPSFLVEFGAQYLNEYRWKSGNSYDAIGGFLNFWFGWSPSR